MSRTPAEQRARLVEADEDLKAFARRMARETRLAQGLPEKVTDLGALARVATLMKPAPSATDPTPSARTATAVAAGSGRVAAPSPPVEPPPGALPAPNSPGGEGSSLQPR